MTITYLPFPTLSLQSTRHFWTTSRSQPSHSIFSSNKSTTAVKSLWWIRRFFRKSTGKLLVLLIVDTIRTYHNISRLFRRQFPDQKRITMFSSNKLKQVQSTFFFSVDAVFPPEVFECIPSTSGVTKASKYYGHHTLALATRFRWNTPINQLLAFLSFLFPIATGT